jgi:hypothetical protein
VWVNGMTPGFDLVQSARGAGKLAASVRYGRRKQAMSRLRAGTRKISYFRRALKVARAETKDLKQLLKRSGVSAEDMSRSGPALLRCLVQRQFIFMKIGMAYAVFSVFVMFLPFWILTEFYEPGEIPDIGLIYNLWRVRIFRFRGTI